MSRRLGEQGQRWIEETIELTAEQAGALRSLEAAFKQADATAAQARRERDLYALAVLQGQGLNDGELVEILDTKPPKLRIRIYEDGGPGNA